MPRSVYSIVRLCQAMHYIFKNVDDLCHLVYIYTSVMLVCPLGKNS